MIKNMMLEVSVLLTDDHYGKAAAVALELKSKGFVLNESLDAIGVLIGSAPSDSIESLSKVIGVSSIEETKTDYHTQ